MKGDFYDPKALIREAYNIEAITRSECRSIFLDWALSLPLEQNSNTSIQTLLKKYKNNFPENYFCIFLIMFECLCLNSAPMAD